MPDLFERFATLWGSGLDRAWVEYQAAQADILTMGQALVGQTPAEVIYEEGALRLLHYAPRQATTHPTPVLCIPSLINRYYVLDLIPERSLVLALLEQGLDVYMIDWGTATAADRFRTLDSYVAGLLRRCVQEVQARAGIKAVTMLGYCMGGLFALAYAVLFPREVALLVNMAGPVNYHDHGIYSTWTRSKWFDADLIVDTMGNVPAQLLNATFHSVRPTNELVQAVKYWQRRDDEAFMRRFAAMQVWLNDPTPFPGEAFRKYIKDLYQQNLLLHGTFELAGQRIDPRTITTPTLTIAARKDHIAPWRSVAVLHDLVASEDRDRIVLESGHIGMVIGSTAHEQLWPHLGRWLVERSG